MNGPPVDLSGFRVVVVQHVPATPDAVWAVLSDLPGMAERSPEVVSLEWDDPDQRTFTDTNARGGQRWTVRGHVVAREAPVLLRWTVLDPAHPSSTWSYELQPDTDGTRVVHTFVHGPGPSLVRQQAEQDPGRTADVVAGRTQMLHDGMAASLQDVAESFLAP